MSYISAPGFAPQLHLFIPFVDVFSGENVKLVSPRERKRLSETASRYEEVKAAVAQYAGCATALQDSAVVAGLRQELRAFYALVAVEIVLEPVRFFAVSAPSGAGKTQLALQLGWGDGGRDLDVVHIPLFTGSAIVEQGIYRTPLAAILKDALKGALLRDVARLPKELSATNLIEDSDFLYHFETLLLLSSMFDIRLDDGQAITNPRLFRQILRMRLAAPSRPGIQRRLPVMVIDECWPRALQGMVR